MSDQSNLFDLTTFTDSPSAISSPALESGRTPSVSQDGPTTNESGPHRVRASRSARRAKRKALRIDDTFGQSSFLSSESEDLSFALANRLRLQMASLGSTMFELTWKARRTPSGRLIFAQRARALRTSETALSSWPTCKASDGEQGCDTMMRGNLTLQGAARMASWPTPSANEYEQRDEAKLRERREKLAADSINGNGFGLTLANASHLASWPTPQTHDVTTRGNTEADHHYSAHDLSNAAVLASWPTPCVPNGGRVSSNKKDMNKHLDGTKAQIGLENAARLSSWAAPTKRDHKDSTSEGTVEVNALLGRQVWLTGWQTPKMPSGGGQEHRQTEGGGLRKLEDQVILAGWPTPMAGNPGTEEYNEAGNTDSSRRTQSLPVLLTDSGGNQVGFYADQNGMVTVQAGGPLNAAHSRWLMGLPVVWDDCGVTAMESLRRSSRSSSKRASQKEVI